MLYRAWKRKYYCHYDVFSIRFRVNHCHILLAICTVRPYSLLAGWPVDRSVRTDWLTKWLLYWLIEWLNYTEIVKWLSELNAILHACMNECMHAWMNECIHEWIHVIEWNKWMHKCPDWMSKLHVLNQLIYDCKPARLAVWWSAFMSTCLSVCLTDWRICCMNEWIHVIEWNIWMHKWNEWTK